MNFMILGAGAMGALFGGRLAESRPDWRVILADDWPEHVAAMKAKGLELEDEDGDRHIPVEAVLTSEVTEPAEVIMVFTKAVQTSAILARVAAAAIGPETMLMSLQNGLGNCEILEKFVSPDRIIFGMTTYTSDLLGPGRIKSHGRGVTRMMIAQGRPDDPRLAEVARALSEAGLNAVVDPEVEAQIWRKVGFNSAFNPLCALTRLDCGGLGHSRAGRELMFAVAEEAAAVAAANGVAVKAGEIIELLKESLARHARHEPSMVRDVLAGRPTEIESLNGAIVRLGRAAGVPTPVNEVVYNLITAITEASPQ